MGEAVNIARPENKTSAQLEWIPAELVLRVPCGFGASAGLGIVPSQQVKQVCVFEFHRGIGFAFFVNEQGKGDARFFAKSTSINAIPEPYSGHVGSAVPEGLIVRAQLRDVFTAEDSTVMAQENHNCRLADP